MFLFMQGPVTPVQPQINHSPSLPVSTCQPITVPLCKNLAYTETAMPNVLGHTLQADANLQIQTFAPLIQVGCSPHLTQFLCSVYTPECVEGRPQPPCRMLCETVKSSCEPVLNRHELLWPEALKCEAFTTDSCKDIPALPVSVLFWNENEDVCGSDTHLTTKFCVNLSCSFCIILLTIQPTSKHTNAKTKPPW